jgi:uncharacterized protein
LANLYVAFITGLTTGGLSCLAVQGGLLASSLAGQIEQDFQNKAPKSARKRREVRALEAKRRAKLVQPILAFLTAKVVAYTLLGFLLGLAGQMFQLSPIARAALQIGIGIFMLGTALRMLNVHPIFRYFVIEPPAFLRRWIRRIARQSAADEENSSLAAPAFLGLMTVLIPCGITQAMMAVALGTANPLEGAALMLAFTLGTSPVFFAVSYFATQLGARLEKYFMRFVAVVILVLAVLTIDSGLTLSGSPYSLSRLTNGFSAPQVTTAFAQSDTGSQNDSDILLPQDLAAQSNAPASQGAASASGEEGNVITIQVSNSGYMPRVAHAKAGVPIQLRLITSGVQSCSRAIIIPALNVQQILQETGEVDLNIPAQAKGSEIPYSCSMGMFTGTIRFDL